MDLEFLYRNAKYSALHTDRIPVTIRKLYDIYQGI